MIFPNNNNDTFNFEINYDITDHINLKTLTVIRTDKNEGWGQDLKLKIINNNTHLSKIINIGPQNKNNYKIDMDIK
jgi:hypothetical protein